MMPLVDTLSSRKSAASRIGKLDSRNHFSLIQRPILLDKKWLPGIPDMKSRPKVLLAFAISPNKIGGMEIFGAELATQLNQKGMDLVMCFQEAPPPLVRDFLLKPGNVSLDILQHQEAHGTAAIRDYIHLLRRHRPCIVLYSLGGAVRWWPLLGMIFGVRRTVYFDQTSRSAAAMTYRAPALIRLMMKPLYASGCATDFIKACSDREGIVPPHKSRRIYSAIDLSKFHGQGKRIPNPICHS